eukprot:4491003-Amphidinium_carterae.1
MAEIEQNRAVAAEVANAEKGPEVLSVLPGADASREWVRPALFRCISCRSAGTAFWLPPGREREKTETDKTWYFWGRRNCSWKSLGMQTSVMHP